MNPNNCATCEHQRDPDGGWCYMFRVEPTEVCMQHTGRRVGASRVAAMFFDPALDITLRAGNGERRFQMKIDPRKAPNGEQRHALKIIGEAIGAERGNERETLRLIAAFAICMMHGTFGKEYCRGFLQEALVELDQPDALKIELEVRHATRMQ